MERYCTFSASEQRSPRYFLTGIVAAALLAFLVPEPTVAQQATVGLKGGAVQSTFVDNSSADFRTGSTAGVYIRYDVNPAFSVQPEVVYSVKGAETEQGDLPVTLLRGLSGTYKIQYLEFPILFKLNAPLGDAFHAGLFAGPQLGFKTEDEIGGRGVDQATNNSDTVVPLQFSGTVGGDLGINLSEFGLSPLSRIVLDGRYTLGFTNTFEVSDVSPSIKNGSFSGTLGVEFSI